MTWVMIAIFRELNLLNPLGNHSFWDQRNKAHKAPLVKYFAQCPFTQPSTAEEKTSKTTISGNQRTSVWVCVTMKMSVSLLAFPLSSLVNHIQIFWITVNPLHTGSTISVSDTLEISHKSVLYRQERVGWNETTFETELKKMTKVSVETLNLKLCLSVQLHLTWTEERLNSIYLQSNYD